MYLQISKLQLYAILFALHYLEESFDEWDAAVHHRVQAL